MKRRVYFRMQATPGKIWEDRFSDDHAYWVQTPGVQEAFDQDVVDSIWSRVGAVRTLLNDRYLAIAKRRHEDKIRREAVARLNAAQADLAPKPPAPKPAPPPTPHAVVQIAPVPEPVNNDPDPSILILLILSGALNLFLVGMLVF